MKEIRLPQSARPALPVVLCCCLIVIFNGQTRAQSSSPDANVAATKIERARSLAVIGNFTAAAGELESVLTGTNDDALRDVARILLMSVYLKQSNYTRADAMLDESYKARVAGNENTTRVYFALAGQLINGIRSRLDRYREFGLNPAGEELSTDARSDVDQLRVLLERIVVQAKTIRDVNATANTQTQSLDSVALLEDAATVRLTLSHGAGERTRWQREIGEARQYLVTSRTRLSDSPAQASAKRPAAPAPAAANNQTSETVAAVKPPAPDEAKAESSSSRGVVAGETSKPATPAPNAAPPATNSPTQNRSDVDANSSNGGAPVSVGSLLDKATQKIAPTYPPLARNLGVAGVVTVYVVVDEKGQVEAVERTNGPALLQRPATDAARRWRFRPTLVEGQPVRVSGYISFNFAL